jgi:hypothetical protein
MSTSSQPERDRLLACEIYGEVGRYAPWRELTADEHAAAVTVGKHGKRAEPARAGRS